MSVIKRTGELIVVVSALLLGACDQARRLSTTSDDNNTRYELQRDDQGRIIRLDKVTGEVAIVKGETLIPATPSDERPRPTNEGRRSQTSAPAKGAGVTPHSGLTGAAPFNRADSEPAVQEAPSSAPEVVAPETPQLPPGSRVTIIRPSPVYLTASENRTPLEVLASGMRATILKTEGQWYFISFESPRWGPRVGFLKSTAVDYDQQPLDLSVPDRTALEPLDLSVPDTTALEPLDLSVPDAK